MSQLRGSQNYIWSVTDLLGQGATGNVYKCRHKRTGELYAVKTFNSMSHMRPADIQMREFEVLKKLSHENIVQLHGIEEESYVNSRVLVMDLCTGGSLFSMLDDPENAYGLEEKEFLSVLRDVAAGMKHLRDNSIVHRDIKPGNIMRYITDDGRSVYKLIDFGAARQLEDEEQFVSLYGTEEYLYPDMYERAVLRRPSSKPFTATVDLWSIGVTLYHIATGQLPFRPFGGSRRNKELMYKITTEKASGVISGIQHIDGGPIDYSHQLPCSCRLSKGLRQLVTPLLAGLLENDADRSMNFEQFFNSVQEITNKNIICIFHATACSMLHIYINCEDKLAQLQDHIASQTDIRTADQQLLFESHSLNKVVRERQSVSSYPHTAPSNPIFLFPAANCNLPPVSEATMSSVIPVVPTSNKDVAADAHLDQDALYAKNCCAVVHCVRRLIQNLLRDQQLMSKAAKMYRLVLERDVEQNHNDFTGFTMLVSEIGKRLDTLVSTDRLLTSVVTELSLKSPADSSVTDLTEVINRHQEMYAKLKQQVDDNCAHIEQLRQPPFQKLCEDASWLDDSACHVNDNCEKKADVIVSAVRQTLSDFAKDKQLRRLSFNEDQIHKFEKHKMKMNTNKAISLLQTHCLPNTKLVFDKFAAWFRHVQNIQSKLSELTSNMEKVVLEQQQLTSGLDQVQSQRTTELCSVIEKLGIKLEPLPSIQPVLNVSDSSQPQTQAKPATNGQADVVCLQLNTLNKKLVGNSQQMAKLKRLVEDNDKHIQTLCSRQTISRPTQDPVPYVNLDETANTLTS